MYLKVTNFAKISQAKIIIDSITVLAGLNNTAKSTIGKLLYSVIMTFNSIEDKITQERYKRFQKELDNFVESHSKSSESLFQMNIFESLFDSTLREMANSLTEMPIIDMPVKEISGYLAEQFNKNNRTKDMSYTPKSIEALSKRIKEIYSVANEDIEKIIFAKNLNAEFNGQYSNINRPKEVTTIIFSDEESIEIKLIENKIQSINDHVQVDNTAVMIDNPFVLDKCYNFYEAENHNSDLYNMLYQSKEDIISGAFDEVIATKKLRRVYDKLESVVKGDIKTASDGDETYQELPDSKPILLSNLSTGLKTFVVIKKLLMNNILNQNSIIILDEPEIHLHPEWQIILAELIVLLQIELELKVVITTHSPYFLNALEVFTQIHGCKNPHFYLSELVSDSISFREVTDSLEEIYNLLAKPFQTLENLKYGGE